MARFTALLVAALASVLLLALPAMAQYPPAAPSVTVETTAVLAGGSLNVSGDGWLPGSTVSLTLLSTGADLGTASVDGDGRFNATVTIPAGTPAGTQTIRVSGTGADGEARTVDIAITVQGAGAGVEDDDDGAVTATAGGGLAATGGFFSSTSAVGALLLVVGGGALYASRRLTRAGTPGR